MIGIVILNFRTPDLTINCANSIIEKTQTDYKIYIVDNASGDGSYAKLSIYYSKNPKVSVVASKINGGYSKGNNIGARLAINDGTDCIAVINSDIELMNNCLDILYKQISSDEDISVVGPSIFDLDNKTQHFARRKLDLQGFLFAKKPLHWFIKYVPFFRNNRMIHWGQENSIFSFFGMVSGCCFMIKSDIFNKIGLFDENIFLFHEEDILAYKLTRERKKAAIIFEGKVLHSESSSVSKKGTAFTRYFRTISALYVLRAYARIGNIAFLFAVLFTIGPLLIYSTGNLSYRKELNDLLNQIKIILRDFPEKKMNYPAASSGVS